MRQKKWNVKPSGNKPGFVEINFDGHKLSAEVTLVNLDDRVSQWDALRPMLYIDRGLPEKYWPSVSLHELVESTVDKQLGIGPYDKNGAGHSISESLERKAYLKTHTPEDWRKYSRIVDNLSNTIIDAKRDRKGGRIEYLSPERFLRYAHSIGNSYKSAAEEKHWPREDIQAIKKKIMRGEDIGTLVLDFNHTNHAGRPIHDGRLRMKSLQEMGITSWPVLVYGKMAGGKELSEEDVRRAFDKLNFQERKLKWGTTGLNHIVQQQTQEYEKKEFGKDMRRRVRKMMADMAQNEASARETNYADEVTRRYHE